MLSIFREYKTSDKIGYFIANNAANNDAALRLLSHHIEVKPSKDSVIVAMWSTSSSKLYYMVFDSEHMLDAALSKTYAWGR